MKWIKFTDQKPTKGGRYLVHFPAWEGMGPSMLIALWRVHGDKGDWAMTYPDRRAETMYWMELPPPPEVKT